MPFKKMRSVNLSYNKQGEIYFILHNYADQPDEVRQKIDSLCGTVGKYNHRALFRVLTTDEPINRIAREHYISARQLYYLKSSFYNAWHTYKTVH
uniref:Uncharacterized protein n=1 Tax=Siphoviridae sp. ctiMP24 TaxID=2825621 RepID=A0A8S5P0N0_9CAUD|nr:MAG TPA: hypothetical protein [Siphoviridae sp. ctiMP24]